ncbi:acyltransferase-like protein, chloroplastic isoform X1 [Tanacetum coccineum]|uniref:Acyltransferase-like protein, chloroplastic isoform X1 n=1 Tax=Tanacetum coccineum TaxID=301880 RepID=A0ABQ5AT59_9ASTR
MSIIGNISCYSHVVQHLHQQTVTTTAPPRFSYGTKDTSRLPYASVTTNSAPNLSRQINNRNNNVRLGLYLEHSKYLTTSKDGGPPRWFTPLESGSSHVPNSPLLLYLPGIDGSGLGLSLDHSRLGEMFDIWCLHIPATDRTPFPELVKLVERTLKSENRQSPDTPIYLVGQSFGACLALVVAARNPEIDIILVLANSATSFNDSQLRLLLPLLEAMPKELDVGFSYVMNLMKGMVSTMAVESTKKKTSRQTYTRLYEDVMAMFLNLFGVTEVFSVETLVWKLRLLDAACSHANPRLHAVKSQTLILSSGNDLLLPSRHEGERLHHLITKSEIRTFDDSGHMLFMDEDHDLVNILKATSFYRRKRELDYVLDYLPPSPYEFNKARELHSYIEAAFSPVMLSTLENGRIVRGLSGIPSEGPVLFVGYHMLLGLELSPLVLRFFSERGILVRGMAHPIMFNKFKKGSLLDTSQFDTYRTMGAVPVSPTNLFKLFKQKSHILLYPGGAREALHRKGEEYKLFWPEHSEFVRMAARFGAKIIPFGVVGEDDSGELITDYEDQMKIPCLRRLIQDLSNQVINLRSNVEGELANQALHIPLIFPKIPGRFYYLFGKPIKTLGRQQELRNKDKADELYLELKAEVESCLSYLKEKRKTDPYRSILSRLAYQLSHGTEKEIPTFEP